LYEGGECYIYFTVQGEGQVKIFVKLGREGAFFVIDALRWMLACLQLMEYRPEEHVTTLQRVNPLYILIYKWFSNINPPYASNSKCAY
jgi:hypothetical protein